MLLHYILIIIGIIIFNLLFNKFPTLKESKCDSTLKVSVIIPARNEEKNIDNLLTDLENQTYDIHEIICVDDNSTDSTATIIKKHKVKYILLDTLPKGWKGKTWACQNGALKASGEVLIFLDSNVRVKNTAIESLISTYKKGEKPLSIQPYHIVKKNYEYLSIFFNFIQLCVTYLTIFNKKDYLGFYGPTFIIDRELFFKHGGYEKVKNAVVEDLFLGKYYKKVGIDVDLLLGGNEVKFTMYPESFSQLVEGWSKNFAQAALSIRFSIFFMVFIWITYLILVPYLLFNVVVYHQLFLTFVLGTLYFLTSLKLYHSSKYIGSFPFFVSLFYPLYLIAFMIIFVYSFFKTFFFKNTTWKGRVM